MLIRKPTKQAISYRFFAHRKRPYICVCSLFFFPFDSPRDLETEQEMWPFAAGKLGQLPLEESLPKGAAEVLAIGDCHAPEGTTLREAEVGIRLGAVEKRLKVTGRRIWRHKWDNLYQASAPEPFTSVPLSWQSAFGGNGFAANPLGRGFVAEALSAENVRLPQVEYPGQPVTDPDSRPKPASFAPIAADWPQRTARYGDYGAAYLQGGHFPGLAADTDFKAFNRASADQWQKDWFAGDERYAVLGMHPGRPRIEGRLPEIRARCFLDIADGKGGLRLAEVPQNLDTVWLFPGDLRGILVYRGAKELATPLGDEIAHMLFAYERMGTAPRPLEHYAAELRRRVDPKASAAILTYDTGLKPEDEGDPPPDPRLVVRMKDFAKDPAPALAALLAAQDGILAEMPEAVQAGIRAAQDEMAAKVALPPEVAALQDMVLDFNRPESLDGTALTQKIEAASEALKQQAQGLVAEHVPAHDAMRSQLRDRAALHGFDYDAFEKKQLEDAQRPLAEIWADGKEKYFAANKRFEEHDEELRKLFAELREEADKVDAQMASMDADIRAADRAVGHMLPLPAAPSMEKAAFARAALDEALTRGEKPPASLVGVDLAGMDFSGRDLEEMDFRGANLRGADFRKAKLARASFAQADIAGADFTGADLTEANLAKTSATGTRFTGADLTKANCGAMNGARAAFDTARLNGTGFGQALLPGASFTGAVLQDLVFEEGDLSSAGFVEAALTKVIFSGTPLPGADFSRATLATVLVQNGSTEGARFDGAVLDQFGVQGEPATLRKASFVGARIATCSLRLADLTGADFTGAVADGVDFSETRIRATRFEEAVARGAIFTKAEIVQSSFARGNFSNAIWLEARIDRTDFAGAVLYGGNFLNAAMTDNGFKGTNTARSTLTGMGRS
ncbi:DUF2169 domain-containing protein [Marinibaculum pumilum]|uniref:DUF2169 domain-containing protein n=1 Tax=Marinibaculum pumilum TaxID=1766165 RepID=A0ABV7KWW3_9PROT